MMFKVGQKVVTIETVTGNGGRRVLHKGATGIVYEVSRSIITVRVDGDRGFMSQDGCWRFNREELSVVQNISVNKDAVHLLSKE